MTQYRVRRVHLGSTEVFGIMEPLGGGNDVLFTASKSEAKFRTLSKYSIVTAVPTSPTKNRYATNPMKISGVVRYGNSFGGRRFA